MNKFFRFSMLFISIFFVGVFSADAANLTIETTGEDNCNRVDTLELGDGWSVKHSSLHADTHVNIGRTELFRNGERVEFHDTVFYANSRWTWWYGAPACATYSRISSATFENNYLNLVFDSFNPQSGSTGNYATTTRPSLESHRLQMSTEKVDVDDVTVSAQAIGKGFNHVMKLNMGGSRSYYGGASLRVKAFLGSRDATVGSSLSSSYYYGQNGCSISDVSQTDDTYIVNFSCALTYVKTSSAINGAGFNKVHNYEGSFTLSKARYNLCPYDESLCEDFIPNPENLQQHIESPSLARDIVDLGEQIGKYQSGSGVIFTASVENPEAAPYKLAIKYERNGVEAIYNSGAVSTGSILETILPYQGTGSYTWSAAVSSLDNVNISDWIEFGGNDSTQADFSLFEGFEPYPFGYSFENRTLSNGTLSGGLSFGPIDNFPYYGSIFIPGNRWELFNSTFDTSHGSGIEPGSVKALLAFSAMGLEFDNPFAGGSCYGMSASALSEYTNKHLFSSLSDEHIWNNVNSPSSVLRGDWDTYNSTLQNIFKYQLLQFSSHARRANIDGEDTPENIAQTILNNPDKNYILTFYGQTHSGKQIGHAVVPYKVEGSKIYFWDNNIPFPNITNLEGEVFNAYDQYLELLPDGNVRFSYYNWKTYDKFSLLDMNDIYNNGKKSIPFGFTSSDYLYIFHGDVNFQITDSSNNVLSYKDGNLIEEINGAELFIPLNANLEGIDYNNNFKMVYFSEGIDDFDVEVVAKDELGYDITAVGGDYYSKISGIDTFNSGIDTYKFGRNGLELDFSDTLSGSYDLMHVGFTNSGSDIIEISDIENIGNKQAYTFDWNEVQSNSDTSVTYEIDSDGDGEYDVTETFPAITQPEEAFDYQITLQNPKHIVFDSETDTYTCNGQRKKCKINFGIRKLNGKNLGNKKHVCSNDFGFGNTDQDTTCNPRKVEFPSGTHTVVFSAAKKDNPEEIVTKEVTVVNPYKDPDFSMELANDKYISQQDNVYACKADKKKCYFNMKFRNPEGEKLSKALSCEIVYPWGVTQTKCNPKRVKVPFGEHEVLFKVYETQKPENFSEQIIPLSRKK